MEIRVGFEIEYTAVQPTPMVIMLSIHPSRFSDIVGTESIIAEPNTPIGFYRDGFGNVCGRLVAPAGGNRPLFGTNPISFAWPRPGSSPIVVDMATAAMAQGEVQIAAREGQSVPLGTGLNANGELTTDPNEILKGVLLPFGGHKGSAVALMVELLAAGAIGERFSFEAGEADNRDGGPPRGGEFMLAMSPELLGGPDWAEHCESFFRRFETIEGARLPGSRRQRNRLSTAPREIDANLVERIRALCR